MVFPKCFLLALLSAILVFAQPGTLTGTLVDLRGMPVADAEVKLAERSVRSAENGSYSFPEVTPGPYLLKITAGGFASKTVTGELTAGQSLTLPATVLAVDTVNTSVNVTQTQAEIAQEQIKEALKQRVGLILPNFFANYNPDAEPLNTKQKFQLTWRTLLDPSTFVFTGIGAGIDQARNTRQGFGQGAQGYFKRYASSYVDLVTTLAINKVIMTSLFKQDPRYFTKNTGTKRSRLWYAINRSVICQGDNRKAQFCYSGISSRLASGYLTNYYYPAAYRNSSNLVLQNVAIGIGAEAGRNLFQEFLARKLMRKK